MSQFERMLQVSSKKSFEGSNNEVGRVQKKMLESKFDFLSRNIRIFCGITKHLADIRARDMKVLERLTDRSYRKFAFAQLATQTRKCLGLMLELYAMVKDTKVCLLLLQMSHLIQKKMLVLDEFFAGIAKFDKNLEKAYLKEIIEYLDSIKEPQITTISLEIDQVKNEIQIQKASCQLKSQYERELFSKSARPFFKIRKLAFEKMNRINGISSSKINVRGTKRKYVEPPNLVENSVKDSSVNVTTIAFQANKRGVKENHNVDHGRSSNLHYPETKENKNTALSCVHEKERMLDAEVTKKSKGSNDICRPVDGTTYIQTVTKIVDKISCQINSAKLYCKKDIKSDNVDKSIKSNNQKIINNIQRGEVRDTSNSENTASQHLQQQKEEERSIRLAKLFCSRSIKSSSKTENLKKFATSIENYMHDILPLLNEGQGLQFNVNRKRKRSIDNQNEMSSALNCASISGDKKRFKHDALKAL